MSANSYFSFDFFIRFSNLYFQTNKKLKESELLQRYI